MSDIARSLLSAAFILFAGAAISSAAAQQTRPAAVAAVTAKTEALMAMRDGVKLAANVYVPAGAGPWPAVLARTPYLKDGAANAKPEQIKALADNAKRYTDAGFAYVLQDVRGKGRSEGFYAAFENDIEDGYDSVEWVAKQVWCNGAVGITGGSALGITSNAAAMAAPPHLKAAYVVVAPYDRLQNTYINGVLKEKDTLGWLKGQGVGDEVIASVRERVVDDVFWNRGAMSENRKYIRIPIYNVGGWYDIFNDGNVSNFEYLQNQGAAGARGDQKLMMGPFGHGPLSGDLAYPGADRPNLAGDQEIRWFEYWLKGVNNGIMDEPPVSFYMMAGARKGAFSPKNRMLHAANWPPTNRAVRYFLAPDLSLSTKAPTAASAKLAYKFDPAKPVQTFGGANLTFDRGPMDQRAIGVRGDYLRFQTPALDKDVVIAGPVKVDLFAATDGLDTDFEAKLVDVYPDGYEALVLDAPVRARFRNGRMPDEVKLMTPGAPEEMVINLWNTALTFEKGHRIALHITSSNSPRFEVNANTGEPPGEHRLKPRVATNTIYLDQAHPSALILPITYPAE